MGGSSQGPQYTGIDKYPGLISTLITLVIAAIFLGGLYREVLITAAHHEEAHAEGEHGEGDHAEDGDHAEGGENAEGDH